MPAGRDNLGSSTNKGGRKDAARKRPGPAAAQPQHPAKRPAKAASKAERMRNKLERKLEDRQILGNKDSEDPEEKGGLQQTVINARGRSRGFYENCVYLTLFCSLYAAAAAANDLLCVSHHHSRVEGVCSRIALLC